ncbi:hypothetical protein BsWGS_17783 [Bradybaena similaris]
MPKSFLISRRRKLQSGAEGPGSKSSRLDLTSLLPDEDTIHGDVKGKRLLVSEHQHRRYNKYLGCPGERSVVSNKADKGVDFCSENTSNCFDLHHNNTSRDTASESNANRAIPLESLKRNLFIDLIKVDGGKCNSHEFAFNKRGFCIDSKNHIKPLIDNNNEEGPSFNPCVSIAERTEYRVMEKISKQVRMSATNDNVSCFENGCTMDTPSSFFNHLVQSPEALLTHDETTDHLSQTPSTDRTSTNYLQKLQKNSVKKTDMSIETTKVGKYSMCDNNSKAETLSDVLVTESPLSCATIYESGKTIPQRATPFAFSGLSNVRQSEMAIPVDNVEFSSQSLDNGSMTPLGSRTISRSTDTPGKMTLSGCSPSKAASVSLPLREAYDTGQSCSEEMFLKELYARGKWLQERMARSLLHSTAKDTEQDTPSTCTNQDLENEQRNVDRAVIASLYPPSEAACTPSTQTPAAAAIPTWGSPKATESPDTIHSFEQYCQVGNKTCDSSVELAPDNALSPSKDHLHAKTGFNNTTSGKSHAGLQSIKMGSSVTCSLQSCSEMPFTLPANLLKQRQQMCQQRSHAVGNPLDAKEFISSTQNPDETAIPPDLNNNVNSQHGHVCQTSLMKSDISAKLSHTTSQMTEKMQRRPLKSFMISNIINDLNRSDKEDDMPLPENNCYTRSNASHISNVPAYQHLKEPSLSSAFADHLRPERSSHYEGHRSWDELSTTDNCDVENKTDAQCAFEGKNSNSSTTIMHDSSIPRPNKQGIDSPTRQMGEGNDLSNSCHLFPSLIRKSFEKDLSSTMYKSLSTQQTSPNCHPSGSLHSTTPCLHPTSASLYTTSASLNNTPTLLRNATTSLNDTCTNLHNTSSSLHNTPTCSTNTSRSLNSLSPVLHDTSTSLHNPSQSVSISVRNHNKSTGLHGISTSIHNAYSDLNDNSNKTDEISKNSLPFPGVFARSQCPSKNFAADNYTVIEGENQIGRFTDLHSNYFRCQRNGSRKDIPSCSILNTASASIPSWPLVINGVYNPIPMRFSPGAAFFNIRSSVANMQSSFLPPSDVEPNHTNPFLVKNRCSKTSLVELADKKRTFSDSDVVNLVTPRSPQTPSSVMSSPLSLSRGSSTSSDKSCFHDTFLPLLQQKAKHSGKGEPQFDQNESNEKLDLNERRSFKSILEQRNVKLDFINGGNGIKNPLLSTDFADNKLGLVSSNCSLPCPVCSLTFDQAKHLQRHLKTHREIKRFLCSFCGKGFNDTFDLKRHTRTHTGVKPYKCSQCEKAFTQRCSLESHCRKIHGQAEQLAFNERRVKLYVCEACGHSTDLADEHYAHNRHVHPSSQLKRRVNLVSSLTTN